MSKLYIIFFLPLLLKVTVLVSGSPSDHGNAQKKFVHLHFFWHDTAGGQNPSVVNVAKSATTNSSPTHFGTVRVMDDPITVSPNQTSELLGRSQGIYVPADQTIPGLMMAMNFHFVAGEYNGSSFSVLGRNMVNSPVREMPVVGGTGKLRFATGYVKVSTYFHDPTISYFIAKYKCYIIIP